MTKDEVIRAIDSLTRLINCQISQKLRTQIENKIAELVTNL